MRSTLFSTLVVIGLTLGFSSLSPGADQNQPTKSAAHQGTAGTKMTPELKKDLADMYQKMADCMRTDKSLDQCNHEAMQNCPVVEKTGHCPINEGMGPMMDK